MAFRTDFAPYLVRLSMSNFLKLYFYDTGLAANLLGIGRGDRPLYAIEVKSSATYRPSAFENLEDLAPIMGVDTDHRFVVYGGSESFPTRHGKVLDFDSLEALIS